jgi:hypothetical protein
MSIKNPIVKNILSAIAVAGFGFILLNAAFLFDFLYQSAVGGIIRLFMPLNPESDLFWFPPTMHVSFMIIIVLMSWSVFRSKLGVLNKATFSTVPLAAVLVTMGMFLHRWPILSYSLGGLFCTSVLYYLYRAKRHWLYMYAVILVGLVLAIFSLSGGEI